MVSLYGSPHLYRRITDRTNSRKAPPGNLHLKQTGCVFSIIGIHIFNSICRFVYENSPSTRNANLSARGAMDSCQMNSNLVCSCLDDVISTLDNLEDQLEHSTCTTDIVGRKVNMIGILTISSQKSRVSGPHRLFFLP
jgi:hypothetical protein